MITIPSNLIFVGYGFLAASAFLNSNLKGKTRIYWVAVSLGFLRMILMVFMKPWDSYDFTVKYAEPAFVVFIGLTCLTIALWRRFIKVQP
jgi:hypothetical protein